MAEYIEREAALEICQKEYEERLRTGDYCGDTVAWNIGGAIKGLPTAAVAPAVYGHWEYNTDDFTPANRCSNCRYNKPVIAGEGTKQEPNNYCPNCGAKMEEAR